MRVSGRKVVTFVLLFFVLMPASIAFAAKVPNDGEAFSPADLADPVNGYLAIQVAPNGRFNSGATGVATGSSFNISYAWPDSPWSSFTTIRIDGSDNIFGSSGDQIQAPTDLSDLLNESVWQWGNVQVKQTLQIVNNTATGRPDIGMYKYTVTNLDSVAHDVGVRVMIDTMLNWNDGAPFRVPGAGSVTTEREFTGDSIPQYWQAFYSLDNPEIMAQGTLSGSGATRPDRFVLSAWYNVYSTIWDYAINPDYPVTWDSAATLWWNPVTVAPGQSREFVTFYGLGSLSGNADLSITGPAVLDVIDGDWSPNPFTITAYVANNTYQTMTNVPVSLSLPAGLSLQTGADIQVIPAINPGETMQVSWNVEAVCSGDLEYSVSATGRTVSRQISAPPIKPELTITQTGSYWKTLQDYLDRALSVDYSIKNTSSRTAYDVQIVTSTASNGVSTITSMPADVGDISGGSSSIVTLKYMVPLVVAQPPILINNFSTEVTAASEDQCGHDFTYPGQFDVEVPLLPPLS